MSSVASAGGTGRGASLQVAPSAIRNIPPILDVLGTRLPASGRALEIASGTGQHVCAFAAASPGINWTPSDPDASARASVAAWTASSGCTNIGPPLDIDVTQDDWTQKVEGPLDVICAINMIHISPWGAALGLLQGAGALLCDGGLLYLYGPYMRDGVHIAPSNAEFDKSLKSRNPLWGVRDIADVSIEAGRQGMVADGIVAMPSNNFSLLFVRRGVKAAAQR